MAELGDGRYGKSDIRLVRIVRGPERHELHDYRIDVQLVGDFAATYLEGHNTDVMATDTMRNTVYARAQAVDLRDPEVFGQDLAGHFLRSSPGCREATVRLRRRAWSRTRIDGEPHPHAFQLGDGGGSHTALVVATAAGTRVTAGIDDLTVLKTTGSGFEGFQRDRYTTLPETDDRILATDVRAEWDYGTLDVDWAPAWDQARAALLEVFATLYSRSLQQTLYAIGEAILAGEPAIDEVRLSLPNNHHLHVDLGRFGVADQREVFHASAEPYGLIEGTVRR
jgi:urate oxidase